MKGGNAGTGHGGGLSQFRDHDAYVGHDHQEHGGPGRWHLQQQERDAHPRQLDRFEQLGGEQSQEQPSGRLRWWHPQRGDVGAERQHGVGQLRRPWRIRRDRPGGPGGNGGGIDNTGTLTATGSTISGNFGRIGRTRPFGERGLGPGWRRRRHLFAAGCVGELDRLRPWSPTRPVPAGRRGRRRSQRPVTAGGSGVAGRSPSPGAPSRRTPVVWGMPAQATEAASSPAGRPRSVRRPSPATPAARPARLPAPGDRAETAAPSTTPEPSPSPTRPCPTTPAGSGGGSSNGGNGGGLYSSAGSATLSGDTFTGDAGGNGGNSIPVDPGCTAPGLGGDGGAIYSTATLSVTNSTLSGNTDGQGGFHVPPCAGQAPNGVGAGIAAVGGTATVSYSTIADNTDGIDNLGGGTITLGGTIVADRRRSELHWDDLGDRAATTSTAGPLAASRLAPTSTRPSPCSARWPTTVGRPRRRRSEPGARPSTAAARSAGLPCDDQRGLPRPDESADNGACDIGAYESQGVS